MSLYRRKLLERIIRCRARWCAVCTGRRTRDKAFLAKNDGCARWAARRGPRQGVASRAVCRNIAHWACVTKRSHALGKLTMYSVGPSMDPPWRKRARRRSRSSSCAYPEQLRPVART